MHLEILGESTISFKRHLSRQYHGTTIRIRSFLVRLSVSSRSEHNPFIESSVIVDQFFQPGRLRDRENSFSQVSNAFSVERSVPCWID